MPGETSGASSPAVSFLTPDLEDARDNVFFQTVKFVGLLQEFIRPEVRYALQSGSICECGDVGLILSSVDEIRRVMLPTLSCMDEIPRRDRAIAGVRFFVALLAQTDEEPRSAAGLPFPKRMTFKEWFKFFCTFSSSEFWRTFRPGPTAFINQPNVEVADEKSCSGLSAAFGRVNLGSGHHGRNFEAQNVGRGVVPGGPHSEGAGLHGVEVATSQHSRNLHIPETKQYNLTSSPLTPWGNQDVKCGVGAIPKIPGNMPNRQERSDASRHGELARKGPRRVVVSSGSSTEESETTSEGSSSNSSGSYSPRKRRRKGRRRTRDVLSPGVFDGLGSISLRRFLTDYEHYFSLKFDGTSRQQAKHLGEFLAGHAREAYEAVGGAQMDYSRVKKKLLSWYSGERVSSRQTAEVEFDRATMRPSESLTIFALRMERLAARAFPASRRERNRHLSRKIWASTPASFVRALTESRRSLALSSGRKTLKWTAIKRLAETEDRNSRMDPDCLGGAPDGWFGRSGDIKREKTLFPRRVRYVDEADNADMIGQANCALSFSDGGSAIERKGASDRPTCNWCGRRGHGADNCWERAGLCTLCGSGDHEKQECSRFDGTKPLFRPMCPRCEGSHLGKYCTLNQLN